MFEESKFSELEAYGFGPNVMKKTRICSKCGRITDTIGDRCPHCGDQLRHFTLFDWYKKMHASCVICGTILSDDSIYCPHCGNKI